ncbi:MAG: Ig-like domain-containing protein, partial [Flavobacteriales bacterium]
NPCDPDPSALGTNDCDNDGLDLDGEILAGTDPNNPDTDGDGILDGQEVTDGNDPLNPCDPNPFAISTNDCDNDGLTNGEEELGTDGVASTGDETNPADADTDNDGYNDGEEVLGVDDLSTVAVTLGTSNPLNPCDPDPSALGTNDCDNDGLDLDGEILAGTDAANPDTDGDGILDGQEVTDGNDPLNPCDPNPFALGSNDCDNDGLTNDEETANNTNPSDPDTDDDTILDGDEVDNGSDPLNPCDPNPLTSSPLCDLDDTETTDEDTELSGTVVDVSDLTYTIISGPSNGELTLNPDGTFTYTPNPDFNGNEVIVYQACDINDVCDESTLTITVLPVNDAPNAEDDFYTTSLDTQLDGNIGFNDTDSDGVNPVWTVIDDTNNGIFVLNPDGSFTYIPNTGYLGGDTLVYSVCDAENACDTATVYINVIIPNEEPIAENDEYTTDEDTSISGTVADNDSDPEGDDLTWTAVGGPSNGIIVFNSDGTFTYTPNPDFNGTDFVEYTVCDEFGGCDNGTLNITINPVNDAPDAVDDTYFGEEDLEETGDASENDSDVEGDDIVFVVVDNPGNGTVVMNADGTFTYTPDPDFSGTDFFTYSACDVFNACDTATVFIVLDPTNDNPIAEDDNYDVLEDDQLNGDVSDNDNDPDGDDLTFEVTDDVDNGTLVLNPDGSFTYVPDPGYVGSDSFTYTACDDGGLCDEATVFINVIEIDTPPIGLDDDFVMDEDGLLNGDVSTNDTDVDGDILTFTYNNDITDGTIVFNSDGTFTYTPDPNYNGTVTFTYDVCDDDGNCDTVTVTIVVNPINDTPIGIDDTYTVDEDSSLDGNVSTNDSDVDGDDLTFTVVDDVDNGTLVLNPDGTFTYIPDPDFNGTDSFTYTVCDEDGDCDTVTVIITINPIDEPVILDPDPDYYIYDENEIDILIDNVSLNDTVPAGSTWTLLDPPAHGSIIFNPDGSFTYIANGDGAEFDTFTYLVCDTEGNCVEETVTIILVYLPSGILIVPAGFSPNGDNVNDVFVIDNIENYPNNKLTIFNRWGNVVFEKENYTNTEAWDGTTESGGVVVGSKVPEGTYYYILVPGATTVSNPVTETQSGFMVIKYNNN